MREKLDSYCKIINLCINCSTAAGTPSGFKGWKRKYHSGYLAADKKLYFFFKCDKVNAVRSAKRVRRMASPVDTTTFPPTPCTNDTVDDDLESSGEEPRERRDTTNNRIRRPRPC